jgi:hypothetical protein
VGYPQGKHTKLPQSCPLTTNHPPLLKTGNVATTMVRWHNKTHPQQCNPPRTCQHDDDTNHNHGDHRQPTPHHQQRTNRSRRRMPTPTMRPTTVQTEATAITVTRGPPEPWERGGTKDDNSRNHADDYENERTALPTPVRDSNSKQ